MNRYVPYSLRIRKINGLWYVGEYTGPDHQIGALSTRVAIEARNRLWLVALEYRKSLAAPH